MRGLSRILHETVTEKLEAATAPTTQEKEREEERVERGEEKNVFEGRLYVGGCAWKRERGRERERNGSGEGRKGGYRFLAVIQSTMAPYLTPLPRFNPTSIRDDTFNFGLARMIFAVHLSSIRLLL